MILEPGIARLAVDLHGQGWPTAESDVVLAALLGAREELLAYLFTRTDFLKTHPDFLQVVRELVEIHGGQAATNRPEVTIPAGVRDLDIQIREALMSVAESEAATSAAKVRFDALERQHGLYTPEASSFVDAPEKWFSS